MSKSSKARKSKSKKRDESHEQIVQGTFGDSRYSNRDSKQNYGAARSGR